MPDLCVNVDHVATIRQARRGLEPDPVEAAVEAELGGADGITVHLREDRRHIQDDDLGRLRRTVRGRLNLEMAATDEMIGIAIELRPATVMLVPERRQEITTEGGLGVAEDLVRVTETIRRCAGAGIPVSVFIDAEPRQVEAAAKAGASICELHTGPWAHAFAAPPGGAGSPGAIAALDRLVRAGELVRAAGMRLNAGHALNYANVAPVARLEGLRELHIGHAIVSRAVTVGMRTAVRAMKELVHPCTR